MIQRCENPNATSYIRYGERGISVCERWKSFEAFLADMGSRPLGATLDRIDSNGNYEPGNVRWATEAEQQRNRRDSLRVVYGGKEWVVPDLADHLGLPQNVLSCRVRRGCPEEKLGAPPTPRRKLNRAALLDAKERHERGEPLAWIAAEYKVDPSAIAQALKNPRRMAEQ